LFGPAYRQLSAYQQRVSDYIASAPDPRGVRERIARGIFSQTSVMAEQGLNPASIFSGFVQDPREYAQQQARRGADIRGSAMMYAADFAAADEARQQQRGEGIRERAFGHAYQQSRRQDQLDMRASHARRTHALRNALNEPWGWGADPSQLDEAAAMEQRLGGAANAEDAAEGAALRARTGLRGWARRQFTDVSGRRLMGYGIIAAHEINSAVNAIDRGELAASLATTPADELRARIQQQQQVWGGFGGSTASFILGRFGAGPEPFLSSASRTLSVMESQTSLRAATMEAGFGASERSAMLSGDTIERRRIDARRTLAVAEEKYNPQIETIQQKLRATKEESYQTGYAAPSMGVEGDFGSPTYATRTVPAMQGEERQTQQNKLRELTTLLDEVRKGVSAEIDDINRQLARAKAQMGLGTRAAILRAQGRDVAAGFASALESGTGTILNAPPEMRGEAMASARADMLGAVQGAFGAGLSYLGRAGAVAIHARSTTRRAGVIRAARMGGAFAGQMADIEADEQEQLDETEALPPWIRWLPRMAIRGMSQERKLFSQSERNRQTRIMDTQLQGRSRALDQLLDRNPIGASSTDAAAEAIAEATSLRPDRPDQSRQVLQNALKQQQLIQQNYGRSLRAVQFDSRENFVSPRDQEDIGKTLKSIDDNIQRLLEKLAIEQ
jgi:hypothetical protein